jgi:hypothetical protein
LIKNSCLCVLRASAVSPYYGIDSMTSDSDTGKLAQAAQNFNCSIKDLFSFHFSGARVLVTYFEVHTPVSAATARTRNRSFHADCSSTLNFEPRIGSGAGFGTLNSRIAARAAEPRGSDSASGRNQIRRRVLPIIRPNRNNRTALSS